MFASEKVTPEAYAFGPGVAALGLGPGGIIALKLRKRLVAIEVDQIVAGRPLKTLAAAVPVLCPVDERAMPKHRNLHGIRVEAKVYLLRVADADAARARSLDEVAVNARLAGDVDRVAGRERLLAAALGLDDLLGQLQPLDARAGHVQRQFFLTAFLKIFQPKLGFARFERNDALHDFHRVYAVVVHNNLVVDVELRSVVRPKLEFVIALFLDGNLSLEHHAEVFRNFSEAGIGRAALRLASLEWLELGKIRQFVPATLVGGEREILDLALGNKAALVGVPGRAITQRADVGDQRLHLLVVNGRGRRHRGGGLLGHLVHRLADGLDKVFLVEHHLGVLAAVAQCDRPFFAPEIAHELGRTHGDTGRGGHIFVHLMTGETDLRLEERLALCNQIRVIGSIRRQGEPCGNAHDAP